MIRWRPLFRRVKLPQMLLQLRRWTCPTFKRYALHGPRAVTGVKVYKGLGREGQCTHKR